MADDKKAPARYGCETCGYVYDRDRGDDYADVEPGTDFEELPVEWRCPVCRTGRKGFQPMLSDDESI